MVETELYLQSIISQLVRQEQDLRKLNETMLIIAIEQIRLNRLTQKTLAVQFNVMDISDSEVDKEFVLLQGMVEKLRDRIKEVSNHIALPQPKGSTE